MKKLLLILCLLISFSNYAVSILHTVVPVDDQPAHQFEVTDAEYPPYYADTDGGLPESGYSYTWYTDEGHISNEEKPRFFFATSGPHQVQLTLTPRKKGDDDLKVYATIDIFVTPGQESPSSNGDMTDVEMYVDGEARKGDRINVVIPLDPCKATNTLHDYRLGFDHTKLEYVGVLPQERLTSVEIASEPDVIGDIPLTKTVDFKYDWGSHRDDVVAVFTFKVLADHKENMALKFHESGLASCVKDESIFFSSIAGPYDPNFKESDISEINVAVDPSKIVNTTEVIYTIHFQNVGEAPVDSITVVDALPTYLTFDSFYGSSEPSSIVSATHTAGTLKWIIAPDADVKGTNETPTQPEPTTKGWVRFKGKIAEEQSMIYDTCVCLKNIATIYFDDLDPIDTKADLIVIGDALCFSPDPGVQGNLYAHSICGTQVSTPPATGMTRKVKRDGSMEEAAYVVYPNPFTNSFQLKGDTEKIQRIEVLNALGQSVLLLSKYENTISLDEQPNGLYFVRIISENKEETIRIEKQ